MKHTLYTAAAAIMGGLVWTAPSAAQSLTGNVGSAGVTKGERAVEARQGFDEDGNAAGRIHGDYSFTDSYQLRLIASFSKPDDEDWDYSSFTVENWFQWSEEQDDNSSFNGGVRLAYGFADEGPDEAEVRLTVTDKFADGWEWRANAIGEVEVGDDSEDGVALETRAQLSRTVDFSVPTVESWRLGVELFSEYGTTDDFADFDEQAHQVGPVVKASWANGVYLQSAVRVGLTDGSDDAMAKVFIGREF